MKNYEQTKIIRRFLDSPFAKTAWQHVLVSMLPVLVYGGLLVYFGYASREDLLGSLFFFACSLFVYNALFATLRTGRTGGRRFYTSTLAENPVEFFTGFIITSPHNSVFCCISSYAIRYGNKSKNLKISLLTEI